MDHAPLEQVSSNCEVQLYFDYLHQAANRLIDPYNTGHPLKTLTKSRLVGYEVVIDALQKTQMPDCTFCPHNSEDQPCSILAPAKAELKDLIQSNRTMLISGSLKVRWGMTFLNLANSLVDRQQQIDKLKLS